MVIITTVIIPIIKFLAFFVPLKEALKNIMDSYRAKMEEVMSAMKDGTKDESAGKAELEALELAMKNEIDSLLTDEQKERIDRLQSDMKQKIDVYPLKAFQEYIFVILEISYGGSHNVSSVDIYGGPLIDPVKKHHAHFEHFSSMKKNVSFDESKNEIFVNNPRKFSKWIIPSALAIILTPFLYKKIKL